MYLGMRVYFSIDLVHGPKNSVRSNTEYYGKLELLCTAWCLVVNLTYDGLYVAAIRPAPRYLQLS